MSDLTVNRDTAFLEEKAPIDKLLRSPLASGAVSLHILLTLERIEQLLKLAVGEIEVQEIEEEEE